MKHALLALPLLLLPPLASRWAPQGAPAVPWPIAETGWRTDAAWYDGKAEKATYAATRTIYGKSRAYTALAYTNKQRMDPSTTTKSSGENDVAGTEVFKHHWSERIPTESYDYDLSTATFTTTGELRAFKLTVATQEDCGASFKQAWRSDANQLEWFESVYFPDAGMKEGRIDSEAPVHFTEELPLLLRDFPFDAPPERTTLVLVPGQKHTDLAPDHPETCSVTYVGKETLELPIGSVEAHHLAVAALDGEAESDLWFDARGEAPWLHVLVRYAGPDGVTYALAAHERTAYWER